MSSRLAIVGCLGRSLGQTPTSAKSESDWIHFVTPRHRTLSYDHQISGSWIMPTIVHNYQIGARTVFWESGKFALAHFRFGLKNHSAQYSLASERFDWLASVTFQ
jgi:hypothetical protein